MQTKDWLTDTKFDPRRLRRRHRVHRWTIYGLPMLVIPLAIVLTARGLLRPLDLGLLFAFHTACNLGISLGYHRLASHRSLKLPSWLRLVLYLMGSWAGQGPLLYWVSVHRRHHLHSDRPGDPHAPHLGRSFGRWSRFWSYHWGWLREPQRPLLKRFVPDLLREASAVRADRNYLVFFLLGLLLPGLIPGRLRADMGQFRARFLLGRIGPFGHPPTFDLRGELSGAPLGKSTLPNSRRQPK